jgi:glutathione S-transferase
VSLEVYVHPFSSYCWKVLIPLYADGTPFEYRNIEQPENMEELKRRWPFGQFPVLVDDGQTVVETTCIIEHLQAHHRGANTWIPDGELGRRDRFLDRFFYLYVMDQATVAVANVLRPEDAKDPFGLDRAMAKLTKAYDWLETNLGDGPWAAGDAFTLADCAAAPSLFYADWVQEIGADRPRLAAYRSRLLAHPAVARAVDEARPYRSYFPLGAPDRD